MYNYIENMTADILEAIAENYGDDEINEKLEDRETFAEELNDMLWNDDSVTGNASGSYTFNREAAREYVSDNMELCVEAVKEFCVEAETVSEKFLASDWEYFDVIVRCYLLGQAIENALDEMEAHK